MRNQNIFYVDLLGFEIIRENYRKERDDYKIDLACGEQEIELFIIKDAPARVNYPEALGLRHLAFKVKSVDDTVKELICRFNFINVMKCR